MHTHGKPFWQQRAAIVLILLTASGCAARRERLTVVEIPPPPPAPPGAPDPFARGRELLAGIAPVSSDNGWRVGDQVLLGLQTFQSGKEELRYIRITVRTPVLEPGKKVIVGPLPAIAERRTDTMYLPPLPGPSEHQREGFAGVNWHLSFALRSPRGEQRTVSYDSKLVLMGIELFDRDLKRISGSHATAPEACLRQGLYPLAAELLAMRQQLGPNIREVIRANPEKFTVSVERLSDIIATLFSLRDALWSMPDLMPLMEGTIQKPSLLSILLNGGVQFSIQPRYEDVAVDSRSLPAGGGARPPILLPFDILLNGQASSHCQISVVPAQPPFQPCAGWIGLDVRHPTDAGRRLHLRLLAAQRGAIPQLN